MVMKLHNIGIPLDIILVCLIVLPGMRFKMKWYEEIMCTTVYAFGSIYYIRYCIALNEI